MRQRNAVIPILLWAIILLLVVWLWRTRGLSNVSTVLSLIAGLVGLTPLLPLWPWKWAVPVADTTPEQTARGAIQLANVVRRQWKEEAGRRRLEDVHQMPVRWEIQAGSSAEAARRLNLTPKGDLDELVAAFMTGPRPLVVVGDPGAGKTGLCVKLLLAMSESPGRPIPLLLPLAGWDPDVNLNAWLVRRILEDYPFLGNELSYGADLVTSLLDEGRILLLLDGLDELPADLQSRAVQAIRADSMGTQPFVLTCRTREFAAIASGSFHGMAVVKLLPLEAEDAVSYLRNTANGDFVPKWERVSDELTEHPDGMLATTLTLPLNLFLTGIAYEARDQNPDELVDQQQFGTRSSIEQHLLDCFIPTVFRRRPPAPSALPVKESRRWRTEDAEAWLMYLAGYLNGLRSHDLAWWRLRDVVPRAFLIALTTCTGALGCLLLGFMLFGIFGRPLLGVVLGTAIGAVGGFAFSLITSEEPRRFVPRAIGRADFAPHLLVRDLGFAVVGMVVGGLIVGILYNPAYGGAVGAIFGVAFGVVRRLSQPTEPKIAVSPFNILRSDRQAVVLSALFGGGIGALVGAFLLGVVGGGTSTDNVDLGNPLLNGLLGACAGFLTGAGGLGMLVYSTSAWGRLTSARLWLALSGRAPWRLLTFLEDAYERGVLRHVGPFYQFRHLLLQDRLVQRQGAPVSATRPSSARPGVGAGPT